MRRWSPTHGRADTYKEVPTDGTIADPAARYQFRRHRGVGRRVRDPLVLAALATAVGGVGAAIVAGLMQRSGKRLDVREAAATRAIAAADRAAEQLEEARVALVAVKDDHIAMLSADNAKLRAQLADLAAKVAAMESRPARKDDRCEG